MGGVFKTNIVKKLGDRRNCEFLIKVCQNG